jgi:Protein of unknown function (DUF4058)
MPLRDHFRPPLDDSRSWDELHGAWPTVIVMALNRILPPRYVAAPRVHLGPNAEINVTAYEMETSESSAARTGGADGGVATAVWAPPRPTFDVAVERPEQDEYEVRVYDTQRHRQLVAAVEIISPANKDRPEHRRAFVAKCTALLQQNVSVALVDLVTTRRQPVRRSARADRKARSLAGARSAGDLRCRMPVGARGRCLALPDLDSHPRRR